MATLCLINEAGDVTDRWHLSERMVAVGRDETADVQVDGEGISNRHFKIVREDGEYFLKDLGSRTGTWINGKRALVRRLRNNETIRAGDLRFRFCEGFSLHDITTRMYMGPQGMVVLPAAACEN